MKKGIVMLMVPVCLMLFSGMAMAEEHSVSVDHVVGEIEGGRLQIDTDVQFHIRVTSNGRPNCMINPSMGFQVYSEDGAEWQTTTMEMGIIRIDTIYYSPDPYVLYTDTIDFSELFNSSFTEGYSITGNLADSIGFSGITLGADPGGVFDGIDQNVLSINIHPTASSHRKHICLDIAPEMTSYEWEWSSLGLDGDHPCDLGEFVPDWGGPYCYEVFDENASDPSNLVISEDTLYFNTIQGEGNPPTQTFNVNSDLDPLFFTLEEDAGWLLKSPSSGTTPQTVSVDINNFALFEGEYFDSIAIVSAGAVNTPQYVYVSLTVDPPPPLIGVSATEFFFNGVIDGDDPPVQYLDITNTGGTTLNWTVSNSSAWLQLTPSSGVDDGTVEVAASVSGLGVGEYVDYIVVDDPNAPNGPVTVEVTLYVASGLPEIGVEPNSNYIVVDLLPDEGSSMGPGELDVPPVTMEIQNVGGGIMNYWIQESSPRIVSALPDAGAAPEQVEVSFLFYNDAAPGMYYDTLWVYSDEATNSPYPVTFAFRVLESPATIAVDYDYLVLDMYQCMDGTAQAVPNVPFVVTNTGDDPMVVWLEYDSEFFQVFGSGDVFPAEFTVEPIGTRLDPGTYYDTVYVMAINAINSPYPVVVECNILPTVEDPVIGYYNDKSAEEGWIEPEWGLEFAVKNDGSGPRAFPGCWILNENYGCMDWELVSGPPWAIPSSLMGTAPHHVSFIIDPTGYEPGTYIDTLVISAPGATNSPRKVPMAMHVWTRTCDLNTDGRITLSDIVYLIGYVYLHGPGPFPEMAVGNCDCIDDGGRIKVTLTDITSLIGYIYLHRPSICIGF